MKTFIYYLLFVLTIIQTSCTSQKNAVKTNDTWKKVEQLRKNYHQKDNEKIKVLNMATFHMGPTSDSYSVEFDEYNKQNQIAAQNVAKQLAEFKPTSIVIEVEPVNQERIQELYRKYVANPKMKFKQPSEVTLVAFEVGRLAGVKPEKVFCIDYKMGYDYGKINRLAKQQNHQLYLNYMNSLNDLEEFYDKANLLDKLKIENLPEMLDMNITFNADIMTHIATKEKTVGADEAAKYYHRNLRMFSNFNQLPLEKKDRVFLLMGASHTAFFRDFISRNPKWKMVNTFDYLK